MVSFITNLLVVAGCVRKKDLKRKSSADEKLLGSDKRSDYSCAAYRSSSGGRRRLIDSRKHKGNSIFFTL